MCLIVVAHRASDRYPLIIAANRDEDHERPSLPAQFWDGDLVLGGRDALHGGSWLAITRAGRFAAVTNLRGSARRDGARSRGELVTRFVEGSSTPESYVAEIESRVSEYGGFHLLAGVAGDALAQWSGAASVLDTGLLGFSNAPPGVTWPKVETAVSSLRGALESPGAEDIAERLMRLLRSKGHGDPTHDLFIQGERYGTRASTVIVVEGSEVLFVEQAFGPGGVPAERNEYRFALTGAHS